MKKIFNFIRNIIGGFKANDKQAIKDAIRIVEVLKKSADSPYAMILASAIPGHVDDIILRKLQIAFPKILAALKLIESGTLDGLGSIIERLHPSVKGDFLDALATQIALVLADGRLTWSEVKSVMKVVYDSDKAKP